jgi:hypothetical protein
MGGSYSITSFWLDGHTSVVGRRPLCIATELVQVHAEIDLLKIHLSK